MPRVLFIDSNHPLLHERLRAAGIDCDLFYDRPADELKKLIPEYDGIVIRSKFRITKEIIDTAPRLKCIGRAGAGMENIDVAYATKKGIACLNSPEGNRDGVAEQAVGMLLALFNNICRADAQVRKGVWIREGNRGTEIGGKTIGIIGYGNTGAAFAKRLSGFECEILIYDKYKKGFGNAYAKEASLEKIFEKADVLSLHIPYNEETHYLVNEEFLSRFRKNIYVINTSRGKCLNTEDLVRAMQSGKVLGACLDVLEYEAVSFEEVELSKVPEPLQYLFRSDKVVLTPHIAGWTHESNVKIARILAEKMIAHLKP